MKQKQSRFNGISIGIEYFQSAHGQMLGDSTKPLLKISSVPENFHLITFLCMESDLFAVDNNFINTAINTTDSDKETRLLRTFSKNKQLYICYNKLITNPS